MYRIFTYISLIIAGLLTLVGHYTSGLSAWISGPFYVLSILVVVAWVVVLLEPRSPLPVSSKYFEDYRLKFCPVCGERCDVDASGERTFNSRTGRPRRFLLVSTCSRNERHVAERAWVRYSPSVLDESFEESYRLNPDGSPGELVAMHNRLLFQPGIGFAELEVQDASTGELHYITVPEEMRRVAQAIAWTFERDETEYAPVQQT